MHFHLGFKELLGWLATATEIAHFFWGAVRQMVYSHFVGHFALFEFAIMFLNPGLGLCIQFTTLQILFSFIVLVELGLQEKGDF